MATIGAGRHSGSPCKARGARGAGQWAAGRHSHVGRRLPVQPNQQHAGQAAWHAPTDHSQPADPPDAAAAHVPWDRGGGGATRLGQAAAGIGSHERSGPSATAGPD